MRKRGGGVCGERLRWIEKGREKNWEKREKTEREVASLQSDV